MHEGSEPCLYFGSPEETDAWIGGAVMRNPKCMGMVFREEGALDTGDSVPAVDYVAYPVRVAGGI